MSAYPAKRVEIARICPPGGSGLSVLCLPHAGGSAEWYSCWREASLSLGVGLSAVRYPGHIGLFSAPFADSIEQLASLVVARLGDDLGGTVLFGHSMGALAAYECARQAQEKGLAFEQVHLSGSRAPCCPVASPRAGLPDALLVGSIGELDPTAPNALESPEIADALLPVLRSDLRIGEGYRREPQAAAGLLHVHVATEDPEFSPQDVEGWRPYARDGIVKHVHRGDHFYLRDAGEGVISTFLEARSLANRQGGCE